MESKGKWSRPDEEIIAFYVPQGAAVVKRSEVSHGSSGLNCKRKFSCSKIPFDLSDWFGFDWVQSEMGRSDQYINFPYNFNTLSSRQV